MSKIVEGEEKTCYNLSNEKCSKERACYEKNDE